MNRTEYKEMVKRKKNTILFYTLVGFVALILSTWIVTFTTYKSHETKMLQEQIDSLVYVASQLHHSDTTFDVKSHLPKNKIEVKQTYGNIIAMHLMIFCFIILIGTIYFKGNQVANKCDIFNRKTEKK